MALVPPGAPPVGVVPALHQPPAPVLPPRVARTYREYYSDRSNNPTLDRIPGFLAGYRFTDVGGAGVPTPDNLRDQTITLSDHQPMAFLCLTPGPDGVGEVTVDHRIVRYMYSPGDNPSGYHDRVLGLLGNILPHQYPVVDVPGTAFHLVGTAARVPTDEAMTALIPTWESATVALGPYTEFDPET